MIENPIHIKFRNLQNPQAEFDIIRLEELFVRQNLNHSPFQLHLVEFYLIIFIEGGQGKHTIDFTDYDCEKGTVLTVRKDQIQRFIKGNTMKGTMLLFTDAFLVSYLEQLETLKTLQLFNEIIDVPKIQLTENEFLEIADLVERLKKEYFKVNDHYSLSIIRSELHILITLLFRIKSSGNSVINRKYLSEFIQFQRLVEQHATQFTRVKRYAEMMSVSTKTLNNFTKTIVSKSAKEFIDDICTQQIKRLLINTELSVKEIAYTTGFEETTNFYKYFKRQTQLTPEQFRASYK